MAEYTPKHFSGDTTPVGASELDDWTKSNKDYYVYCDGQWVFQGNRGQENMGLMSQLGGIVAGLLSGAHGLAPENDPNFHNSARRDDLNLIDESQLEQMEKRITARLSGLVSSTISTSGGSLAKNFVVTRQVRGMGDTEVWTPEVPKFNGVDPAERSQVKFFACIQGFKGPDGAMEFNFGHPSGWWLEEPASETETYTVKLHARQQPGGIAPGQCIVVVLAIAYR